jgi:hypothetical protein
LLRNIHPKRRAQKYGDGDGLFLHIYSLPVTSGFDSDTDRQKNGLWRLSRVILLAGGELRSDVRDNLATAADFGKVKKLTSGGVH